MEAAVRQIIENLVTKIKHDNRRLQRPPALEGDLLVWVNAVNSSLRSHREGLFCIVTVAAAGQWIANDQTDKFYKVIERLLFQLSLTARQPDTEDADLNERLGSSLFRLTFEISERNSTIMADCLTIQDFLHRISIVNPQLKIEFYIKVNEALSNQIFGNEKEDKFCIKGQSVLCASTHYIKDEERAAHPHCCRLHPVAGKSFSLSVPNQLAEDGVCGLLEMIPIVAICPCLKNYPNKPASVSSVSVNGKGGSMYNADTCLNRTALLDLVHIFIYGPADLPVSFKDGLACPDISFTVQSTLEDGWSERGGTQEQTVLLFLFIKYWDDFHLELLDIIGGQQIVVEHLDQILNCNKEVVRECIQPVLRKVLDEYVQLRKNQRRVQTATHIIYDAIQSIVSCSTNHGFRTRSLQLLQVSHTQEMKTSLQSLLQNVIQNRFLSSRGCNIKQVQSDDGDRANSSSDSAIPEASQENLCETDNFQMIYSEPEGSVSGTRKRQLEMNTTNPCMNRSSRPPKQTTDEVCHQPRTEHVSTALVSSLKTNTQLSASGPTRSASDGQGSNVSTREKAIADQEDFLWLQEVHNLTEWT